MSKDYKRFFEQTDLITTEPKYDEGVSYLDVEDLYQAFKERMIEELNLQKEEMRVK